MNESGENNGGWAQYPLRTASVRGRSEPCPVCQGQIEVGQKYYDCKGVPVHYKCSMTVGVDKVDLRQGPKAAVKRLYTKKSPKIDTEKDLSLGRIEAKPNGIVPALIEKLPDFESTWDPESRKSWFSAYNKILELAEDVL